MFRRFLSRSAVLQTPRGVDGGKSSINRRMPTKRREEFRVLQDEVSKLTSGGGAHEFDDDMMDDGFTQQKQQRPPFQRSKDRMQAFDDDEEEEGFASRNNNNSNTNKRSGFTSDKPGFRAPPPSSSSSSDFNQTRRAPPPRQEEFQQRSFRNDFSDKGGKTSAQNSERNNNHFSSERKSNNFSANNEAGTRRKFPQQESDEFPKKSVKSNETSSGGFKREDPRPKSPVPPAAVATKKKQMDADPGFEFQGSSPPTSSKKETTTELTQFPKISPTSLEHEFIYGNHAIEVALQFLSPQTLQTSTRLLYLEEQANHALVQSAISKQIPVEMTSRMRMGDVVLSKLHEGLVLEMPKLDFPTLKRETIVQTRHVEKEAPVLMLWLDEVSDPVNLASILRSAHYFGVYCVVCSEKNSAGLTPLVSFLSHGASILLSETNRLLGTKNLALALQAHKQAGWRIVGTSASPHVVVGDHDDKIVSADPSSWAGKTILIMGSEGSGLRDSIKRECDVFLHLPRPPSPAMASSGSLYQQSSVEEVDSNVALNVSAATAALLARMVQNHPQK